MELQTCEVSVLVDKLGYKQVAGNKDALKRPIRLQSTSRPGLELTGFYDHVERKRVNIIGNKESAYIRGMDSETLKDRFDFLTNDESPTIIVSGGNDVPKELLEVANAKNYPVLTTKVTSSEVIVEVVSLLDEMLAPVINIHGVLMNVFGKGVLMIGESGMGKSEVALELILRGHSLIADDRVDCWVVRNRVMGTSPELTRGLLEIRGIGIIDVTQMFGVRAFLEQEHVDFVIEFQPWDSKNVYRRIGIEDEEIFEIFDEKLPKLVFPVKEGRDMAALVESGVRDFMLKQRGINAAETFDKRVMDHMRKMSEEQDV
ncbi:HPr(Ser) kinase/phosphatase [Erysipelothrix larvae]|nr:HPr(Ser) kinase/phosphatase [Erysipelothrix larvae]